MQVATFLAVVVFLLGTLGCTSGYDDTVLINRATVVGTDWMTVRFPKPLKATPTWEQELLLSPASQYQESLTHEKFGLRMPDGAIVWPECQIESQSGTWLPLRDQGFYGRDLSFTDRALSGNGQSYIAVKCKSAEPISISRLVWSSYDPRVVKR